MKIKALSVSPVEACTILNVGQDVLNRGWKTRFRGWVLLYADRSQKNLTVGVIDPPIPWIRVGQVIPSGGIVGVAEIVDCVTKSNSSWFRGTYGFVLRNVRTLPFTPCKGKSGFFKPDYFDIAELVSRLGDQDVSDIPPLHQLRLEHREYIDASSEFVRGCLNDPSAGSGIRAFMRFSKTAKQQTYNDENS